MYVEWNDINDRLPKNGEVVLVYDPNGGVSVATAVLESEDGRCAFCLSDGSYAPDNSITHWTSRPAGPGSAEEASEAARIRRSIESDLVFMSAFKGQSAPPEKVSIDGAVFVRDKEGNYMPSTGNRVN
jgi:hypothetical protein